MLPPADTEDIVVRIDTSKIVDQDSFHDVFAEAFGFPELYGRNMDAWIDCMRSLDAPDDDLTSVHAPPRGVVVLVLSDAADLARRLPKIFEDLVDCSAWVNLRKVETGKRAVIVLAFSK